MAVRTADPHWVLGTALSLYMQRFAPFRKMQDRGLWLSSRGSDQAPDPPEQLEPSALIWLHLECLPNDHGFNSGNRGLATSAFGSHHSGTWIHVVTGGAVPSEPGPRTHPLLRPHAVPEASLPLCSTSSRAPRPRTSFSPLRRSLRLGAFRASVNILRANNNSNVSLQCTHHLA